MLCSCSAPQQSRIRFRETTSGRVVGAWDVGPTVVGVRILRVKLSHKLRITAGKIILMQTEVNQMTIVQEHKLWLSFKTKLHQSKHIQIEVDSRIMAGKALR